jgi:hypothetical protein
MEYKKCLFLMVVGGEWRFTPIIGVDASQNKGDKN